MKYRTFFTKLKKAKGLNTKEANELISEVLGVSAHTVKSYACDGHECPSVSLKYLTTYFK